MNQGDVAVSAAREFSRRPKISQKEEIKKAGSASAAVRAHQVSNETKTELENATTPTRLVPRRRSQDPDLFWACRSYGSITSLLTDLQECHVFWRSAECFDRNLILENIEALIRALRRVREKMPHAIEHVPGTGTTPIAPTMRRTRPNEARKKSNLN